MVNNTFIRLYIPLCLYFNRLDLIQILVSSNFTFHYVSILIECVRYVDTDTKFLYIPLCLYFNGGSNSQPPLQVVVCVSPHKGYITARPKGRYRKLCHWSAIKRYSWNLLFLIPQPALLYISALLHL